MRVFECAGCAQQHSVTAGTVFHRTRTPLRKWFAAAWLIAQDKRGVSAPPLQRHGKAALPPRLRRAELPNRIICGTDSAVEEAGFEPVWGFLHSFGVWTVPLLMIRGELAIGRIFVPQTCMR